MKTMRAAVFIGKDKIELREVPRPQPGPGEALVRVTLTTICGTDVHILKGEYPVKPGLVVGHEPVGVIEELGPGVDRLRGRRSRHHRRHHAVRSVPRLPVGRRAQCGHGGRVSRRSAAGDSATRSTAARRNMCSSRRAGEPGEDPRRAHRRGGAAVSRHHVDRESRRRRAAAYGSAMRSRCSRRVRSACARPRARARRRVARHRRRQRSERAWRSRSSMGADVVLDFNEQDVGRRDQAPDRRAASTSRSRRSASRPPSRTALRSCALAERCRASACTRVTSRCRSTRSRAGLGDQTIVTTLCPGGKERMRRLMSIVDAKRFPFRELRHAHRFRLDEIEEAYDSSEISETAC